GRIANSREHRVEVLRRESFDQPVVAGDHALDCGNTPALATPREGRLARRARSRTALPGAMVPNGSATPAARMRYARSARYTRSARGEGQREIRRARESLRRRLCHGAAEERVDIAGNVRSSRRDRLELGAENVEEDCLLTRAAKRTRTTEHLVQHHAERPDVGPVVDRITEGLLGAHVANRPDDRSCLGDAGT